MPASVMSESLLSQSVMSPSFSVGPQTNLPKTLISPADIEESIAAYESLLLSAKTYRNALASLGQQANAFGAALEVCSRLKGLDGAAEGLSNVAGMQFVLANRHNVLSDTMYRSFEIPLRENLENFVRGTEQRRETYARELSDKKKLLSKREKAHLSLAHKNRRSLDQFREALSDLTRLADDIDRLKSEYFYNCLDDHSETWARVGMRSNIVCRAELSLYAGVAQKAEQLEWSLVGTPDPWSSETRSGDEIFSIVPPQEILARPQSPSHEGLFQSLLGTVASANPSTLPPNISESLASNRSSEASFFSRRDDVRGVPAMKGVRSVTSSQVSAKDMHIDDESFLTPRANNQALTSTSPYQDAEESAVITDVALSKDSLASHHAGEIDQNTYDTPIRPAAKRANSVAHVSKIATSRHPMTTTPRSTPGTHSRLRTADNGTSDLEREAISPSKSKIKIEPPSPEDDGTNHWKHSEYSPKKIKMEQD